MPYTVKYRKSARQELDWLLSTYGGEFQEAWDEWMTLIAERSEKKDTKGSIEIIEHLEEAANAINKIEESDLQHLLKKRWEDADFWVKIRALITLIKKRTLPWQLRFSTRTLYCLGVGVPIELELVYEIDHPEKCVLITQVVQADDK